ncbi:unnamed protein product, partial [Ixodes pacificus]
SVDAPKIQPFSFPHRLKAQGKTSVMCIATDGTPPFAFSWLKDGVEVTTMKNIRREKKENDYSVLIIEPVEATNAGNYTCIVKNKAGFDSHTTYLEVEAPPTWKSVPRNVDVVKGEPLIVSCHAHGSPTPKVTWMFKKDAGASTRTLDNGTLVLSGTQESQSGSFKCVADNGLGTSIAHHFSVKVHAIVVFNGQCEHVLVYIVTLAVPPKIIAFHFRKTIKPGENARTTCLVEAGDAPMTFSWLRNGVAASLTKNVQIQSQGDFSILNVNPVDATSAGNFTCIVKNRAGFDSFTAYLDVEAPPEWKKEPSDKTGVLGSSVDIDCSATGSPAPKITWQRVKVRHQSAAHPNGTLVLSNLDVNDMGQYMCEANNGVEPSLKKTITVRVNGTEIPEIRPFAFPPNLRVGEKALLTCHVTSGSQPITFSWLKDGNTMAANQGIRLRSESEYSVMLMESVQPTHVGNYTCIAKNKHGFDSFTAVLEVECKLRNRFSPFYLLILIFSFTTLQLDCPAVGYPQPKVSFKKKADIKFSNLVRPHENGTLVLEEVSTADEGQYTCEADNGMAPSATLTLSVTVNGETN